MAKKKNKRSKQSSTASATSLLSNSPAWQRALLLIVPFLLYANTFNHDYALDDDIVIRQNSFTQQGLAGIDDIFVNETFVGFFGQQKELVAGGRYRPLSLVTFAVEQEFFGQRPGLSHFINVVLYALTGLLIFLTLYRLLAGSERWRQWAPVLPFAATLIWIVHPVHTEVVANIKGRDELLAMLFSMSALGCALQYFDSRRAKWLLAGLVSLWLGMLSKENAFTFIAIIPLALFLFRSRRVRDIAGTAALFLIPAAVVLLMRVWALGGLSVSSSSVTELMNNPFLEAGVAEKYATIFFTLGKYIELQLLPLTLTHDYYPYHIELTGFGHPYVLLSVLLYAAMTAGALYAIARKTEILAFSLIFYLATLSVVSNLLFPVGTFMAERLVFMPSLGIALLLGCFLVKIGFWLSKKTHWPEAGSEKLWWWHQNKPGLLLLLIIAAGFGYKTVDRNPVWHSNQTLFLTDVETSENSAKMNNAAGGILYDMGRADTTSPEAADRYLERSKRYLQRAVQIHPAYDAAWQTLGNIYFFLDNDIDQALAAYQRAGNHSAYDNMVAIGQQAENGGDLKGAEKAFKKYIAIRPEVAKGYVELADLYLNSNRPDRAIDIIREGLQQIPQHSDLLNKMGLAYGKGKQNFEAAIEYFQQAVVADSTNAEALENLGVAYGFVGNSQKSVEYFQKALQYNPDDAGLNQNLANAYYQIGNTEAAKRFEQRARNLTK